MYIKYYYLMLKVKSIIFCNWYLLSDIIVKYYDSIV